MKCAWYIDNQCMENKHIMSEPATCRENTGFKYRVWNG